MLEKPNLSDEQLYKCLLANYDLTVTALQFLQLGNDSNGWVYRVATADQTYFLKVKKPATVTRASVRLPHYLRQQGISQIVAPIETQSHTLWADVEKFHIVVYPFIEGADGMTVGLSDSHWIEYGAILRALHTAPLTPELHTILPKENFQSKWLAVVADLQQRVTAGTWANELEHELAEFWIEKQPVIDRIVSRTHELGDQLSNISAEFVICHADIHTANILVANDGGLHVVDWDDPILAPKERDLMFVNGAAVGSPTKTRQEALFFQGYGSNNIDLLILAYYRYEWVVADMGGYGERVLVMNDVGAVTKRQAVEGFKFLFAPGNVVDVADQSDATLN